MLTPNATVVVQEWLTGDSFLAECDARFAALDVNGDGRLSPSELAPLIVELSAAWRALMTFGAVGTELLSLSKYLVCLTLMTWELSL